MTEKKVELTVNNEVIKKVERTKDGWLSLKFKDPHPIPDGVSHRIGSFKIEAKKEKNHD